MEDYILPSGAYTWRGYKMGFAVPRLKRIIDRVKNDVEDLLENSASRIRRSAEYVFSTVVAGATHGLYGYLAYLADQIVPDRAGEEFLVRHAEMWGITRKQATAASFDILVSGDVGTVVAADTSWQRADGTIYTNASSFTLDSDGEALVTVTSSSTGAETNTEVGTELTLVSSVSGVITAAQIQGDEGATVGDAQDQETLAALLVRLKNRVQTPPSGGGPTDYKDWAEVVDGVSRAFEVAQWAGLGTVLVLIVNDTLDSDGFYVSSSEPTSSKVSEVQTYIDERAPITSNCTVQSANLVEKDFSISITPNTAAIRSAVTQNVKEVFLNNTAPNTELATALFSNAVANAAGVSNYSITSYPSSLTSGQNEIFVLGTITFSTLS